MQRVLVILAVILLVAVSLGVGALAAHWPFWQRAWAWHAAADAWPASMPGPRAIVRGGGAGAMQLAADATLASIAGTANTHLLVRVRDGVAEGWTAAGVDAGAPVDGRGLTVAVLPPLYASLSRRQPQLLDRPVGASLEELEQDVRGAVTPRELLARIEGGLARPAGAGVLNPFRAVARLGSGPDFRSAAVALFDRAGDAGPAVQQAAAAQLLAEVAVASTGEQFPQLLERYLWRDTGAADASLLLDRRRGAAAIHCCMLATPADWLRLGLALAEVDATRSAGVRIVRTAGRVLLAAQGRAVLWVGEGDPPSDLETLLAEPDAAVP